MNQFNQSRPWLQLIGLILFILWLMGMITYVTEAKQTQPDAKRVHQIQIALEEHGYVLPPRANWKQTQEILRGIAQDHNWQTHRVPDARVLILLGLGNQYSDSTITDEGRNHLDGGNNDRP